MVAHVVLISGQGLMASAQSRVRKTGIAPLEFVLGYPSNLSSQFVYLENWRIGKALSDCFRSAGKRKQTWWEFRAS